MTADELKSYMLDDFVYDSPTLQFAIYPGIKDGFSYLCTTDIYGKTDEPTQDFKSFEEMLNYFMIGALTLKEVLLSLDIIYNGITIEPYQGAMLNNEYTVDQICQNIWEGLMINPYIERIGSITVEKREKDDLFISVSLTSIYDEKSLTVTADSLI